MKQENLTNLVLNLRPYLDQGVKDLGVVTKNADIVSKMGPFSSFNEYKIQYPNSVKEALLQLYKEYNGCFTKLVEKNREWKTDYKFCHESDAVCNRWVQIDMVGLPQEFLDIAGLFDASQTKEMLRYWIFEIENSLAMYQLLQKISPNNSFGHIFRSSLDELRHKSGKKIALLAVTQEKYWALMTDEFGCEHGEVVDESKILDISGFDLVFNPESFRQHVERNGGQCDYLLYVRSSDPVSRLKNPKVDVEHPLLADPVMREIIRANSLTLNIDNPETKDPDRLINDTKSYLSPMGMALEIESIEDLLSLEILSYMKSGKSYDNFDGQVLNARLAKYLESCEIDLSKIITGDLCLRAKPLQGTYGCYGHHVVNLSSRKSRNDLRNDLNRRGRYVLQPEMPTPVIVNSKTGKAYGYIDRNFIAMLNGKPTFMGGFRSLLPSDSHEVKMGRFHGNHQTVWAGIS